MTARDDFMAIFPTSPLTAARIVDQILNAHAHELAEKIRNSEELKDLTDDHMGDCNAAADLIDPGV